MAVKEGSWAFRRQLNDLHSHDWSRLSIPGFAHAMSWRFHKAENESPFWIFVLGIKITEWGRSGYWNRVRGPILPPDSRRSNGFHHGGVQWPQDPAWPVIGGSMKFFIHVRVAYSYDGVPQIIFCWRILHLLRPGQKLLSFWVWLVVRSRDRATPPTCEDSREIANNEWTTGTA